MRRPAPWHTAIALIAGLMMLVRPQNVAFFRSRQSLDKGLEHLDDVHAPFAESLDVFGHGPPGALVDGLGIDAGAAQVFLQTEPRCRHFRDDANLEADQVVQAKARDLFGAHQEERVAGDRFAECDQASFGLAVHGLEHAHRAAPSHVRVAVKQIERSAVWPARAPKLYLQTLFPIAAELDRHVVGRVEERAQAFMQADAHGPYLGAGSSGRRM